MKLQFKINKRLSSAGITKSNSDFRKKIVDAQSQKSPSSEVAAKEHRFLSKIDTWVFERWERGARTFRELLAELPGIYPAEVLSSLRRLHYSAGVPEFDVVAAEMDAASKPLLHSQPVSRERRHIEHPLDFEWPFTRQGASRICDQLKTFGLKPNSEVLCLGCPSVYLFGKRSVNNFKFRLWDKNTALTGQVEEAREICRVDLNDAMPPFAKAAAVVIDPPWYLPFYELFIWAGFNSLAAGGRIVLSFPPEGTRPSVKEELDELIRWCSLRGLKVESRQPCCLLYRSPLFEVNALKAQGLSNFPLNWRKGDLIVFAKESVNLFAKPNCSIPSGKWEETRVRCTRVKVHLGKKIKGAVFRPVGDDEVLASVSSKHLDRKRANVVTSGNRFIRTSNPEEVFGCFAAIDASGLDAMRKSFFASKRPLLMRKVMELVCKEEREAAQYFRRIHEI